MNEHLNTVALFLPFYDQKTVEKVIAGLTDQATTVPPTEVPQGRDVITLSRADDKKQCFDILARLPTYTIPRARPLKPIPRLAKLAALLAETGLEPDPVKEYRRRLVDELLAESAQLESDDKFRDLVEKAGILDIQKRRVVYGGNPAAEAGTETDATRLPNTT